MWRERGRLLAPGRLTHLPATRRSQWLCSSGRVLLPDTVAGPRRHCTDFRVPRSHFSCWKESYASPSRLASAELKRPFNCARLR